MISEHLNEWISDFVHKDLKNDKSKTGKTANG